MDFVAKKAHKCLEVKRIMVTFETERKQALN
jgi:hypothetical protein